jgi:hypothetical protein
MRPQYLLAVFVLLVGTTGMASADVMFTDLPADYSVPGAADGFGPMLFWGDSFTPEFTGTLDSIGLVLSTQSIFSDPTGTEVMLTDTGSNGKPGNILETFLTGTLPGDQTPTLLTVDSLTQPVLTAGDQYFIIIGGGPGGGFSWINPTNDTVVPVVNGVSEGSYNLFPGGDSEFEVMGTPLSAVPEPRAGFILGVILLAVIPLRQAWAHRHGSRRRVAGPS